MLKEMTKWTSKVSYFIRQEIKMLKKLKNDKKIKKWENISQILG